MRKSGWWNIPSNACPSSQPNNSVGILSDMGFCQRLRINCMPTCILILCVCTCVRVCMCVRYWIRGIEQKLFIQFHWAILFFSWCSCALIVVAGIMGFPANITYTFIAVCGTMSRYRFISAGWCARASRTSGGDTGTQMESEHISIITIRPIWRFVCR